MKGSNKVTLLALVLIIMVLIGARCSGEEITIVLHQADPDYMLTTSSSTSATLDREPRLVKSGLSPIDARPSAFTMEVRNGRDQLRRLAGDTFDWGGCGRRNCMTCLVNHLRGTHHGIKNMNYLRMIGAHSWVDLHDNLHNGGKGCVDVPHQHTEYWFTGEVRDYDKTAVLMVPTWYLQQEYQAPVYEPTRYYYPMTTFWGR